MSWGKSKSEQVVERLGAEMHSAQLRAGDRLGTKETLRARFQVAPATINEALRLLKEARPSLPAGDKLTETFDQLEKQAGAKP